MAGLFWNQHLQKAVIRDGPVCGGGALRATVNNSGEGLYLFYILGKVGVVRQCIEHQLRSQWKIPLPRANEWVFFGWFFVDFKNL